MENFEAYMESPKHYFSEIRKYLEKHQSVEYFRYHSSGDIIDEKYLRNMVRLAKDFKNIKFLAYTKKYELVNSFLNKGYRIPKNLKIVFSNWDRHFKIDNPYNRPTTYVNFRDKSLNPEFNKKSTLCPGSCENCKLCWNLKNGHSVIFNQH